ncbi:MAG: PilZ domain-containing protein [Planctomycetota bacterium]|nr:PilZ domain-containing protein [Planctomycetota bacterium]
MQADKKERRRSKRVKVKGVSVECSVASFWNFIRKPEHETHVVGNISQGGLQMLSSVGFAIGLPLDVVILHPNGTDKIKARGKVIYSHIFHKKTGAPTLFRVGVQLLKFKEDGRVKLDALMADKSLVASQP